MNAFRLNSLIPIGSVNFLEFEILSIFSIEISGIKSVYTYVFFVKNFNCS